MMKIFSPNYFFFYLIENLLFKIDNFSSDISKFFIQYFREVVFEEQPVLGIEDEDIIFWKAKFASH